MVQALREAKDLGLYKAMVEILHAYDEKMPGSSVGGVLKTLLDAGMKVVPKDKMAQEILRSVFGDGEFVLEHRVVTSSVSKLLNSRFADLLVKPEYMAGNAKKVAFWCVGGKVSDRVISLLMADGAKAGFWSDEKGNKVKLV